MPMEGNAHVVGFRAKGGPPYAAETLPDCNG
jgi:hypothetical protein